MNDLFHRFISEEKSLEDDIIQSISEYELNIASLNLELGHPVYTYRGSHLLIVKEKLLKEEHQKLKYQKEPIVLSQPSLEILLIEISLETLLYISVSYMWRSRTHE